MVFFFGVFIASTYIESLKILNYLMIFHFKEIHQIACKIENQMKF